MIEFAQAVDLDFISKLISEHGVTMVLLIYFIWQNHVGKKGIIEKLTILENYERGIMRESLDNSTKVIEKIVSMIDKHDLTMTRVIEILNKKETT